MKRVVFLFQHETHDLSNFHIRSIKVKARNAPPKVVKKKKHTGKYREKQQQRNHTHIIQLHTFYSAEEEKKVIPTTIFIHCMYVCHYRSLALTISPKRKLV